MRIRSMARRFHSQRKGLTSLLLRQPAEANRVGPARQVGNLLAIDGPDLAGFGHSQRTTVSPLTWGLASQQHLTDTLSVSTDAVVHRTASLAPAIERPLAGVTLSSLSRLRSTRTQSRTRRRTDVSGPGSH